MVSGTVITSAPGTLAAHCAWASHCAALIASTSACGDRESFGDRVVAQRRLAPADDDDRDVRQRTGRVDLVEQGADVVGLELVPGHQARVEAEQPHLLVQLGADEVPEPGERGVDGDQGG